MIFDVAETDMGSAITAKSRERKNSISRVLHMRSPASGAFLPITVLSLQIVHKPILFS